MGHQITASDRYRLLTTGEVAHLLFGSERCRRRVVRLVDAGKLGAIRLSENGDRRIPVVEVERFLEDAARAAERTDTPGS